jgi:hydroxyacylglutathione hydrolase
MKTVNQLRAMQHPTVPSTIAEELATNPFLREDSPSLQKNIKMTGQSPVEVLTEIRILKDRF